MLHALCCMPFTLCSMRDAAFLILYTQEHVRLADGRRQGRSYAGELGPSSYRPEQLEAYKVGTVRVVVDVVIGQ